GQNLDTGFKILAVIADQGSAATVQSVMNQLGPLPGLTEEVVRDTAQRANVALEDGRRAWDQEWGGRKTISLEEMQRVADEGPPKIQGATNAINQYLIDTNPEFAAQFASRRGVAIAEMQTMLRDAPTHVQQSAQLYNDYLAAQLQGFIDQMAARKNVSVGEMQTMLRDAPPVVLSAGQAYVQKLIDTNPEFAAQMAARKNVSVEEMRAMLRDAPPIAEDVAWALVGALEGRLPPFRDTVGRYGGALESGVRVVSGALTPFLANRGFGPITAAEGAVIDYYAAGGMKEKHVAQIAQAGSWRVWAEPETGGEAYIPLAVAKRERSTAILEEVASRFGLVMRPADEDDVIDYHKGGICGHQGCQHFHSGGLYVPPPHPQFADFGSPMRPAGSGTTHNMQQAAAEWARRHMREPHHTAPPPVAGGGGGGGPVSGGKALARVQSVLGEFPGARITSTYRSPSQNAAAGGARNSFHMDRNNPAVDIGGPTATLDRLAGRLRGMGGWREGPLWRVRGHYDHVHVADQGLIINSMQSFDQGGWLQPGMTLA
ncbi:MAG TPA: D-Ala-D-Ala carboxypeptidase family metallohydrolase, partial [Acidimicrobiales bacterium]|nr:D-Ala-D-Ala carboxypeptidase family metallohydrolase [Acidimicrobiales bacterium]